LDKIGFCGKIGLSRLNPISQKKKLSRLNPNLEKVSDLGLCMISVLAKRMPLHSADFRVLNVLDRKIRRFRL